MAEWVRLCAQAEVPAVGEVGEFAAGGTAVCLANVDGELRALGNECPHRGAPLGQGTLEGGAVVCPWHAWYFDTRSGQALPPDSGAVPVWPVRVEGDEVLIQLS